MALTALKGLVYDPASGMGTFMLQLSIRLFVHS